ncbi:hypothetical protein ACSBR2_004649 [Camellia fascicularis]
MSKAPLNDWVEVPTKGVIDENIGASMDEDAKEHPKDLSKTCEAPQSNSKKLKEKLQILKSARGIVVPSHSISSKRGQGGSG